MRTDKQRKQAVLRRGSGPPSPSAHPPRGRCGLVGLWNSNGKVYTFISARAALTLAKNLKHRPSMADEAGAHWSAGCTLLTARGALVDGICDRLLRERPSSTQAHCVAQARPTESPAVVVSASIWQGPPAGPRLAAGSARLECRERLPSAPPDSLAGAPAAFELKPLFFLGSRITTNLSLLIN